MQLGNALNPDQIVKMEAGKVHTKVKIGHRKPNESIRILITAAVGIMIGFVMGVSVPNPPLTKINISSFVLHGSTTMAGDESNADRNISDGNKNAKDVPKIWVPTNPKGAERLPPGIVASESDLNLRRLWGLPSEDFPNKPKYLVTFTVGYNQMGNIDKAVKKFSDNFTFVLFHYDGRASEWDALEWSKRAVHISVSKQTKWWYAKRFLHPDIVASYDYIFVWDEDLGLEHFDGEEYIKLVRKYGLEISQPGLEPTPKMPWQMTRRRDDVEVHKNTTEKPGFCSDPRLPPCAAFVEIMAPVLSKDAWRCVWHMIQNDLIHGWGLDFALQKCVEPAHEKIGVVDAQWIIHQTIPSLGRQGDPEQGKNAWRGVRLRCTREWKMFKARMENADKAYYNSLS